MRLNVSFFPPHFPRLFFANFCRNSRNLPFKSKFELTRHFFQLEYYNTEKENWIRLRWNSTYITILSYSILFPNHFRVYLNCIKLYFLKNFVTWYPWVKIAWNKDLCNTWLPIPNSVSGKIPVLELLSRMLLTYQIARFLKV